MLLEPGLLTALLNKPLIKEYIYDCLKRNIVHTQ